VKQPEYSSQWSSELKRLYEHDVQEIWDPSVARHIWNQYHNQLEVYESIVEQRFPTPDAGVRILDIGCAQATLALKLAEKGFSVTAMDIRQEFLDYARAKHTHGAIEFVAGNFMDVTPNGTYDAIFANQIIEHLVYPRAFLARIGSLMKPDGIAVISTPNGRYLKNDLPSFTALGEPEEYRHLQFTADGDGHFFAYDPDEVGAILDELGWSHQLMYFESPWISGHMRVRHLHRWIPRKLLKLADRAVLAMPVANRLFAHQMVFVARQRRHSA
jgi:2-polyprenyl-3-methyl-5-hydroxy-6-metoxy-1,4-benzoquinol methylase